MRHEKFDQTASRLIVLPHIDPARDRTVMTVAAETNVAQMVALAFPGLPESALDRVRVTIGEHVIAREAWRHVRPRPGATAVIRMVPGDDTLRSVLQVAVVVAAVALGQFYASAIAGSIAGTVFPSGVLGLGGAVAGGAALTSVVGAAATLGFTIAGSLLVNALVPVRGLGDQDKGTDVYAITGLKNSANPNGVIPSILGTHRYAPPYAAPPFTDVSGDDQYVTAAFNFGHGPLVLRNHRIGDTPIEKYADFDIQIRQGFLSDDPLTLYPRQMVEEPLSFNLVGVDHNGGASQYTAANASAVGIDITFVQGLVKYDDKGKKTPYSVSFAIYQRRIDESSYTFVDEITLTAAETKIVRRNYSWALPSRGQYEILVQRTSPEAGSTQIMARSDWSAIRTFRPEYPINFRKKLCVVAVRIRASNQLNGTLDNYNADASLICPDWDADLREWVNRETSNPASLFLHVLNGPANAYPKSDAEIDYLGLQDWHEFCTAQGLKYDRVHDYNATRLDVLGDIAAAGRATPHDDGAKWGVVIDRPKDFYVSAITPRNSWDFQGSTPQVKFPDGHRIQFIDKTSGYQQAERVVPFPGISHDAVAVTEDLSFPGKTDPDEIWIETRRRQYELIHRRHTYLVNQDIESLVLSRMDMASLNHDVLDRDHISARLVRVNDRSVVLDTPVTMESGREYAVIIRRSDGTSIRRTVVSAIGETNTLNVVGDLTGCAAGDLASFGTTIKGPALDVIVKSIERGDNLTAKLSMVDAAPIIDELTDTEIPPAWDPAVGEIIDASDLVPPVPSFTVTDDYYTFNVNLSAAGGVIAPASYVVSYRLTGGGAFSMITIPASQGVAQISGFAVGDTIDVKARSLSAYGVASADSAVIQATLHEATANSPTADKTDYTADSTVLTADHF